MTDQILIVCNNKAHRARVKVDTAHQMPGGEWVTEHSNVTLQYDRRMGNSAPDQTWQATFTSMRDLLESLSPRQLDENEELAWAEDALEAALAHADDLGPNPDKIRVTTLLRCPKKNCGRSVQVSGMGNRLNLVMDEVVRRGLEPVDLLDVGAILEVVGKHT